MDLVTIGANPQIAKYDPPPPTFDAWINHGTSKSRDAAAYFLSQFGSRAASDNIWWHGRRIVNTRIWKWPGTQGRYFSDIHGACARTCAAEHLEAELRALRPAVILTYNDDAMAEVRRVFPRSTSGLLDCRPSVVRGIAAPDGDDPSLILVSGLKARKGEERAAIRGLARAWIEARLR